MRMSDWSSGVCSSDLHTEQSSRLLGMTIDGIRQFLGCVVAEVKRLTQHWSKAAHLPHHPLHHREARMRFGRQETAALLRDIHHDRAGFEDRERTTRRIVIDKRGHHVVGADFRSEEHTSELQSLMRISYAVFCL